ncbi:MAG: universal stress protein [Thermodesulfobacteriota bacterium]
MYKKILVPLDGSKLAECVLPHVQTLAQGSEVKEIVFVRVVEPFYPRGDFVLEESQIKKMEAEHKAAAAAYLKNLTEQLKYDNIKISHEVLYGLVAEVLADYAAKNQIDLIIIATHGRSGVSRWVWGSIADRILRYSCAPVLMVRAPGCVPGI